MAAPLDWENLRFFAALHRHKSLAAAGRALAVNPTTLGRRLAALEEQLGVLLFQRTAEGLVPTEAAATVAEAAQRMERHAELLPGQVAGRAARLEGVVRLAVTETFAESFLLPRWSSFADRHPGVELQLLLADRYVDLARGEADLAVRFQRHGGPAPAQPGSPIEVRARRIGRLEIGVYAARAYLARAGTPRDVDDVDGHALVLPHAAGAVLPGAPWFARVGGRGRAVVRTDGLGAMVAATVAGLGLGALSTDVADARPELARVGDAVIDQRDVWLLMPADLARVERVRAVWDHVLELAASHARKRGGRQ